MHWRPPRDPESAVRKEESRMRDGQGKDAAACTEDGGGARWGFGRGKVRRGRLLRRIV